jgi:porphobilinogen deaminase
VYARILDSKMIIEGEVLSHDGKQQVRDVVDGPTNAAIELGQALARALLRGGAGGLLSG